VRVLVQYREQNGLTQAEVARRMKTSQPYVARLEGANVEPRVSTIVRYAVVVAGSLLLAQMLRDLVRGSPAPRF
jgi:predicted transcriptional regulator